MEEDKFPENQLIREAKKGDREAFRDLVERYFPVVERFAYQIGSPASQIDDITQEVFLRVYRFLGQYTGGAFSTWLYRITLNISRDMVRKDQRNLKKSVKLYRQPQTPSPEVESELLKNEEHRHLHQLITSLDEKYRVPLVLFYFQEKKYEEIAEILSVPLSTVKTRISRARKRLETALNENEGGEDHGER